MSHRRSSSSYLCRDRKKRKPMPETELQIDSEVVNCRMLAVLCGKVTAKQPTPPSLVPEAQPRLSYPFTELISSGRLEVHTLINPTIEQFWEAQQNQPNLIYIQGQQLENEEEIGTLIWGDVDVSDPQMFCLLISPPFPTMVYLEVPNGEKLAQSLQSKEVQNVVLGPHLLGDAPKINISPPENKLAKEEEDISKQTPAIKIYDEDVNIKLLICGASCTLDACFLSSIEDGLNALLNIEFRLCKIQDRDSGPPHLVETLLCGEVAMYCDVKTCSSHVSLLVSGSVPTCLEDERLESHIKQEIIEKRQTVRAVLVSNDVKPSAEPVTSMSVAHGASTFEVWIKLPKWAAQLLKYLAQEISYKSLAALGIACVNGTPVSSFDRQDVERFNFFCTNRYKDEATVDSMYFCLPRWSASLAKDRLKRIQVLKPDNGRLSDAPKINIFPSKNEMVVEEGEHFLAIMIYDDDVNMKLLICGAPFW
uniref:Uncharacterized protein n=1 Tax=Leersia perrieri TaxID=77586 RepID=A0A0D9X8H9_9ORYZ